MNTADQPDYELLQLVIELTPRNANGSRSCAATIAKLASHLCFSDPQERLRRAQAIFDHFREDGTTPAKGLIKLPGFDPFPWEPNRILVGYDGTYMLAAEATLEYTQSDADWARAKAEQAQKVARAAAAWWN